MRVLHLYAGNLYGGVERLLVTMAKQWRNCPEMEPTFGVCFEGRLAEELRESGMEPQMLGPVRLSRPWTVWSARRRLKRMLRNEKFDVAICHSCWPHLVFGPAVRGAGCPLVFWAHGVVGERDRQARWAMRTRPDLVLANSEFTKKASTAFSGARCEVMCYAVAPASTIDRQAIRKSVRESLGVKPDAVVVVMASRLERWKGHRLLLEALAMLKETPNWECWIAGGAQRASEKAYLAELHGAAKESEIAGRVRFLGERRDVANLLAAADVHCQPNIEPEPFGIAFVEALYAGLPVVTTSMGGAMEIVNESCGRVVRPGDAGGLADALEEMICNPEERSRLGAAGPARANELCDAPARLDDLRRLFEDVLR